MLDTDQETGPHDTPKAKMFPMPDGSEITTKREDPYGFWYLKSNRGELPVKFQGAYTSLPEVERALRDYTNSIKVQEKKTK